MFSFPKTEKLCGQLRIAALYKQGRRFTSFPLRVTVKEVEPSSAAVQQRSGPTAQRSNSAAVQQRSGPTAQRSNSAAVLIWAPKSIFKHAVDRNHMRRLIREAYRLEKQPLIDWCEAEGKQLQIAFNYMDKEQRSLPELRRAIRKAIRIITKE